MGTGPGIAKRWKWSPFEMCTFLKANQKRWESMYISVSETLGILVPFWRNPENTCFLWIHDPFLKIIQNHWFFVYKFVAKPLGIQTHFNGIQEMLVFKNVHLLESFKNHYTEWWFSRRKRYTGVRFRRPKTATCIAFPEQDSSLGVGNFDGFS